MNEIVTLPVPAREALREFAAVFQDDFSHVGPLGAAWAPGRVNLIGEHTDYNAGYVLPLAVDRVVAFAGRARDNEQVRLWSMHFQQMVEFSLEGLPASFDQQCETLPGWARYVLGVAAEIRRAGLQLRGFDAVLQGDVPVGFASTPNGSRQAYVAASSTRPHRVWGDLARQCCWTVAR